jgi:predicted kinase
MTASQRKLVLMSGYPGSGKSTLARQLAERLGYALICKDALLMTIYGALEFGPGDAAASLRTGAAAWAVFWQMAAECPQAVLDTNIQAGNPQQIQQLRGLGARIVEVRCVCPPEVAIARYAERAKIGHAAQRYVTLDADRLAAYAGPIGVGELLEVDTGGEVDADQVAEQVRRLLGAH